MNKKLIISILSLTLCFSAIGCGKDTTPDTKTTNTNQRYFSNYTGAEITKTNFNNPPFLAMIENSVNARPQSGLSSADIIFETSAEGGIPRFMALFHSDQTSKIGPIRSVRPYYIEIAREFGLPFAHCGGSAEAIADINTSDSLMSMNEFSKSKYYWRDNNRKAPHNLYTSSKNIINCIKSEKYTPSPIPFYKFDDKYITDINGSTCNKINININSYYSTSYEYKNGKYYKSMDKKPAIDKENNEQLSFSNVIIQKTPITINDDNIHLNIKQIGSGQGYLISQGKSLPITWSKDKSGDRTIIKDQNNKEISLTSGKTIWHIIDTGTSISLK